MQSTGALGNMDPEMAAHRRLMCDKIAHIFRQKRTNVSADYLQRLPDIVKRLELGLYRSAASKDDYLNMETLEARLQAVFRSLSAHNSQLARTASPSLSTHNSQLARASSPSLSTHNSQLMRASSPSLSVHNSQLLRASSPSLSVHNSQLVRASSPSPANTMIPTPGMSHGISSWRSSTASPAGSNSMSSSNGPANGSLPMGYLQQAPSNASAGQLMPTPGLTVRQSLPPTMLMQQQPQAQQQQHQHQNGGSLHSLGALVGANSRRFSSGGPLISSAVHFMHNGGPVASDDGLETVLQKHQQQQQQQQQQIISVGSDGYGMNTVDLTGDALSYDQSLMNSMSSLQKPGIRSMEMPSPGRAVSMIDNSSLVAPGEHFKYHQQAYGLQQSRQQPIHTQQAYNQFSQLQSTRTQPNDEQEALRMASSPNHSLRMPGFGSDGSLGHTTSQPAVAPLPSLSGLPSEFQPDNLSANFLEAQDLKPGFPQGLPQMHRQTSYLQKRDFELQSEEQDSLSTSSSKPEPLNVSPDERHLFRDEFQQRMIERDAAQRPHYSIGGAVNGSMPGEAGMKMASRGDEKTSQLTRERQYMNQQRWLLFLRHARRCPAPRGKCQEANCITVQQLVVHMASCKGILCGYPRCRQSKALVKHYCGCRAVDCPVCVPVRVYISKQRKVAGHPECAASDLPAKSKAMRAVETCSDLIQSSLKRMKVDFSASSHVMDVGSQTNAAEEVHRQAETVEMKTEFGGGGPPNLENTCSFTRSRPGVQAVMVSEGDGDSKTEESMQIDRGQTAGAVLEGAKVKKQETSAPGDSAVASTKSGKPKIKGVSLTELFTPEQVREHISSLKRWVGQSKAKAEKNQAIQRSMSENSCQLCAVERLTFDPPPIYCSPCGARIKRNAPYYTIGSGDTRHFFCTHCYNETRGDSIEVEGTFHLKAKLEKKKNDEETEEWWVQCDKCEAWQHQICALFNGRRNDGGEAEYTCPNCYMKEVEDGERAPLPPNAVLGAKDLPGTLLSDHIEQRLFARLKVERQERAKHQGKSVDEVPGVEGLVVRVVSSVDKKLEVKPRFSEMFQEENYPSEFPYKSKVVLLFQNIEGVEVCLFGMYVQEFGAECPLPNQRRVYLSYLDSVKYFRPEIKTTTGEALRTFVYHEILIGYLEYCKKRGFTSCYIWACPPLKGEDYILYCHPEIQKTPKSDKLREWYLAMLRKATRENIVVDLTNLYDHFFMQMGDSRARVTAARLPYFDGDYWPGAAEDMINQLLQEEDDRKLQKKGKAKKIITKRSLKAAGQSDLSGNASKDFLLMQKLGETIFPMKEDFIMVHLQHACSHCCVLMVSGVRWACTQCKKFQLCDRCHDAEVKRDDRERHPSGSREKHLLARVEISDVPEDTKDADEILESEFFDTRQAFLSLCQGNHYQYDTLRRAKHSSMMVLYHLHNPTAPAFVTTCNLCHRDIETGQGWRCEICPDFDVCNNCYQKSGGGDHPHRLTNHPSVAERDAQNKEARQKRVLQLRKMLDLLVHAAQCRSLHCQYPNCRKVKGLFRHGINCRTRASGGCVLCKKMWYLLQLHARACKESNCHVPRCRDLREHLRRLQQQSDSRRRAAVMEMMRQRTAEVSGNV